jgi:site-specific DNA recombinase
VYANARGPDDLDDVLKTSLADIKADRDRAQSALDRINERSPAASIDRGKIERFGSLMRENTTTGDVPFRKAYLRRLIDAVNNRVIRTHGAKSTLEQAVIASSQAARGAAVLYELRAAVANPVNEQRRANVMVNSSPSTGRPD